MAADVSQNANMLDRAKNTWIARIEDGESIAQEALNLAEEKRWREFQGRIYLAVLRRLAKRPASGTSSHSIEDKAVQTSQDSSTQIFNIVCHSSSPDRLFGPDTTIVTALSAAHRTRLFEGHWVLTKIQREFYGLEKACIPIVGTMSTMTKLETTIWHELWEGCMKLTVRQQQSGLIHDDPLAMLTKMQELIKGVSGTSRNEIAQELGKLADYAVLIRPEVFKDMDNLFQELLTNITESLPDFFSVP